MSKLEVVDPATVDIERLRARSKAFDAAKYLETDEGIAAYLTDAFADGDAESIAHALGVAARAKSMRQVAERSGLNQKSPYRALSEEGNPRLGTLLMVPAAVGVTLKAEARKGRLTASRRTRAGGRDRPLPCSSDSRRPEARGRAAYRSSRGSLLACRRP